VIVGLCRRDKEPEIKRLFSYENIKGEPEETKHKALTAYLFGADNAENRYRVIKEESSPINAMPRLIIGSKPIDGGHMILNGEERKKIINDYPKSKGWIRPYVGAQEYLNGGDRWILAVQTVSPNDIKSVQPVFERIKSVKEYRLGKIPPKGRDKLKTPGISSLALADTPTEYHVTVLPRKPFLLIPRVSSERREYAAIGWMSFPTIPSDATTILLDADPLLFAILTSTIHMAWLRNVGGRLESRYRYSIGLVYNTFPWPEMNEKQEAEISKLAQAVLDARDEFPDSTLADLYDPDLMPPALRKAHTALDKAVDRLYRKKPFESERERVEHLFMLYEKMVAPIEAKANEKPKRKRKIRR
jgi:hypothetical protein